MGQCTNQKYLKLLPLYEFDLLQGEQKEMFEQHLMECDYCFERVQGFINVIRNVRFNDEIKQSVLNIVENNDSFKKEAKGIGSRIFSKDKLKFGIVPALLTVTVFLILLIISPWEIKIRPTDEATASKNILAILNFKNSGERSDPQKLGMVIANLLITDLSESSYIYPVSNQRLFDTYKSLKIDDRKLSESEIIKKVAEYTQARWIITGNVLQQDPDIIISSEIINATNGKVIATQKVIGKEGENIFSIVDRLSAEIKKDLSLPLIAYDEYDRIISEVTTTSSIGYTYYLEGLDNYYNYMADEAIDCFKKALKYDSTFAMSYYYLSKLYPPPDNIRMAEKALAYSDNVSKKERQMIQIQEAMLNGHAKEAMLILLQFIDDYPLERYPHFLIASYYFNQLKFSKAIRHLNIAIKIDPLFAEAYNLLAYSYMEIGEKEKALQAVDEYFELTTARANAYDSKADIYAKCGFYNEAIEYYKEVFKMRPQSIETKFKLAKLYLYLGNLDKARELYKDNTSSGQLIDEILFRLYDSYLLLFQGKLKSAISQLDYGISLSQNDTLPNHIKSLACELLVLKLRAINELSSGKLLAELKNCPEMKEDSRPTNYQSLLILYIELLAENKNYEKAESVLNDLDEYLKSNEKNTHSIWYCKGIIEFAKNNYEQSLNYFSKAAEMNTDFLINYMLYRNYEKLGQFDKAASGFEKIINDYRYYNPYFGWLVNKAKVDLAYAYLKAGKDEKAIGMYFKIAATWKDADEEVKRKSGLSEFKVMLNNLDKNL